MKIGIYSEEVPSSVGGGHVLRNDLFIAASQATGPHQFEIVYVPKSVLFGSKVKRRIGKALGRDVGTTIVGQFVKREVARRGLDMMWYNHFYPLYIGVPYLLGIFDMQHRLQPWFPELNTGREWPQRERWVDAARRASLITVGSPEAKDQLCHFFGLPHENVHALAFPTPQTAIDAGAAPGRDTGEVLKKYGITTPYLFYPAQFWPHKNHVGLLMAIKLLKSRGHDISLVLTGSDHGNLAHIRRAARDLGVEDAVRFCGFVPSADIVGLYRNALALCYVSFFGPENLPPLEAMALGCPVILSDIPGARALHGDVPFMVDPKSPEAIADAAQALLAGPADLAERLEKGRRFARANDCARYVEGLQNILDGFVPMRRCWQ